MISVLICQIACCAFMTGLIWIIQGLHYPAFRFVQDGEFNQFHLFHTRNISWIVMPVMLLEFLSGASLAYSLRNSQMLIINFVGIILIWLCTFFISVPLHNNLGEGRSSNAIERLIHTNWLRTALWSARLGLLIFFLMEVLEQNHVQLVP